MSDAEDFAARGPACGPSARQEPDDDDDDDAGAARGKANGEDQPSPAGGSSRSDTADPGYIASLEAEAKSLPRPRPRNVDLDALVKEFNDRFFVVNENGKAIVYEPRHDPRLNRILYTRITFPDLEKLYANRLVKVLDQDGKPKWRNAAKAWIQHPDRRQYIGGLVFDPSGRDQLPDVFNLWTPFPVKPREGRWGKLQKHIRIIICGGNRVATKYLLDWMADVVQNPAKQGEVAIVLRGPEGCGKGLLARALMHLLGQHAFTISNARHLTGNFNAHLRDVVFLFPDEAFQVNNRQHVSVLKAIVTEPYLTIEGKYQNAVQAPNFLHIMMASNEEWVVPASLRSRRWLVLDVLPDKVGNLAYFTAIQRELENGGYEAMLYDLLHRNISRANLRDVPVTAALQEQRKRSVDTNAGWWMNALHRCYVFESTLGLEHYWQKWHDFLPTEVLFASYTRYAERRHERHPLSRELFGKWLTGIGAKPARVRKQATGEHITDVTDGGTRHTSRVAELIIHPQPPGYRFGSIDEAREAFSQWSGLSIDWGALPEEPEEAP